MRDQLLAVQVDGAVVVHTFEMHQAPRAGNVWKYGSEPAIAVFGEGRHARSRLPPASRRYVEVGIDHGGLLVRSAGSPNPIRNQWAAQHLIVRKKPPVGVQ